ncbi:MAG: hypothetical protein K2Z80_31625 [Xanthobacteraceae bacterium]|nr:hypothetical protein [Xanthobacteraceae bacterium]
MENTQPGAAGGKLTPAAMDTLRQVHKTFLQFLRSRLRNHGEAEEVMQQFYLRVVAHASQLRKEESAVAWLRRVLQSALSDHRRRNAVRMRAEADFGRKEAAAPSLTEEIDDVVCKCLARLLPLLKQQYAEVLRRVELEGETRESVARGSGSDSGKSHRPTPPRPAGVASRADADVRDVPRARVFRLRMRIHQAAAIRTPSSPGARPDR